MSDYRRDQDQLFAAIHDQASAAETRAELDALEAKARTLGVKNSLSRSAPPSRGATSPPGTSGTARRGSRGASSASMMRSAAGFCTKSTRPRSGSCVAQRRDDDRPLRAAAGAGYPDLLDAIRAAAGVT
jgi:hypothetical protein